MKKNEQLRNSFGKLSFDKEIIAKADIHAVNNLATTKMFMLSSDTTTTPTSTNTCPLPNSTTITTLA